MDFSFLSNVAVDHVLQALHDARVKRALERALFDGQVRRDFRALRHQGKKVREVEEILAERYQCSTETIRTIWYRKRERQTRGHRRR